MKFRGVAAFPKGDGWVLRVSILACAKSIKSVQKKNERQRQRNKPNIVSAAVESLWLLENPRPFPAPFYTASAFFLCGSLPCSLLCVRVILFSEKRTLREKINYERKIHIKMLKITDRTTSTPRWRPPPTSPLQRTTGCLYPFSVTPLPSISLSNCRGFWRELNYTQTYIHEVSFSWSAKSTHLKNGKSNKMDHKGTQIQLYQLSISKTYPLKPISNTLGSYGNYIILTRHSII